MKHPLPIGEVLNEAFQFGLHRWMTVLRYGWAPAVAMLLVMAGAALILFDPIVWSNAQHGNQIESIGEILRAPIWLAVVVGIGTLLIAFFFFSGFMASVYRLVALGEDRPGIFHLRFDGPAWRVFWAYLIYTLINYAVVAIAMLISLALVSVSFGDLVAAFVEFFKAVAEASESGGEPDVAAYEEVGAAFGAFGLAFLFAFIPLIYVNIKLVPFLPGSAAENRILLFGSFQLTRGRFWSILGGVLLLVLMMMVLGIVFQLTVGIFDLLGQFLGGQHGGLGVIGMVLTGIVGIATIFYQTFVYGVQFAFQAIIYRRLKTGE